MTGILDLLFRRKTKSKGRDEQSELLDSPTTHEFDENTTIHNPPVNVNELPQLIVGCGHSSGHQREHNEDAIFTLTTNLVAGDEKLPFGLYIIADGMGGHQYGEIASAVSIRGMASYVLHRLYIPWLRHSTIGVQESLHEVMQEGVFEAHNMIIKEAPGGGTTLTAALILGKQVTITHVGDSRAYLINSDRSSKVLTHDHSMVKRLEELGQLTPEEAANHPQRNVLYRALGQGDPFEPDIDSYQLPNSGYLLICSDGLWGVVPEEEILETISSSKNPQDACNQLVDAANALGGPDNISVILVRLPKKSEG